MAAPQERRGIASGGMWVVDRVKAVDQLPAPDRLATIRSEEVSTGGAPANVLADLARLQSPFPLIGLGVVGDDEGGAYILDTFRGLGVDLSHMARTDRARTSYTDVMSHGETGRRMFFHHRGANDLFGPEHVPVRSLSCRIFHLGYLLMLPRLDEPDAACGTVAARLLRDLREAGIRTSIDTVTLESDRYRTIVPPALRHTDYLVMNEVEVARITGREARAGDGRLDGAALADAVAEGMAMGPMALTAVHRPEGFFAVDRAGHRFSRGSFRLPEGFIKGVVGAGDAFCAGVLYGLHEGWDPERSAHLGTCCAAASLSAEGATDGVKPLAEVLELGRRFPEREPPVRV